MYGKEVPAQEQQRKGNFTVTLASTGNPDFGQTSGRSLPGVRKTKASVQTMAQASIACRAFITEHQLGGGNWAGGAISENGTVIANVSYNGRIWFPLSKD